MSKPVGTITNAIIEDARIHFERGAILSVFVVVKHEDGGTQGFGGYTLGGVPGTTCGMHARQTNIAAEFIVGCMVAAGVDDFSLMKGRAIRVVRGSDHLNAPIIGIGHVVDSDKWFMAKERMDALVGVAANG